MDQPPASVEPRTGSLSTTVASVGGTSTGEVMDRMEIQGLITAAVKSGAGTLLLEDAQFAKLKSWTEAYEWAFSTPDLAACLGAILHAESVPVAELVKTEKAA